MKRDIAIIGAGINGLCAAYYLLDKGYSISIFDKNPEDSKNCSYGNAGLIVPSHFVPLAAPGVISQGLKWMLNSKSPFYIKPRIDKDLIKWLRLFKRHCTQEHVNKSSRLLLSLNNKSKALYYTLSQINELDLDVKDRGLLMLYKTESERKHELIFAQKAKEIGIEAEELFQGDLADFVGDEVDAIGAVHLKGDADIVPENFMLALKKFLVKKGVEFYFDSEIRSFKMNGENMESFKTQTEEITAAQFIVTAGSWTAQLMKKIGYNIPIQAGKGYSFKIPQGINKLKVPMICCETKVAVTPDSTQIKFAGTMEINGLEAKNNLKRAKVIKDSIHTYFPNLQVPQIPAGGVWSGLRPCSPDGIPYVGRIKNSNIIIGTGHGMMGISMGPVTGQLISEQIQAKKSEIDLRLLNPLRFN